MLLLALPVTCTWCKELGETEVTQEDDSVKHDLRVGSWSTEASFRLYQLIQYEPFTSSVNSKGS